MGYQPGLDGLRAISVIAVIFYHAGFGWMSGGFLGVEVFFVVSGFLITTLLIEERERDGGVSLGQFWVRRVRRLFPALFAMLFAVSAWAAVFGNAEQTARLKTDLPWSIFYVNNWGQIAGAVPYFEPGDPPLLRHLWSLAVEEQWYLVWPLVFTLVFARMRPDRAARWLLGAVAVVVVVMFWVQRGHPDPLSSPIGFLDGADRVNVNYLSTITRSGGLLLGAAAAFVWRPWRSERAFSTPSRGLDVTTGVGAGLLVSCFIGAQLTAGYMYPWLLTLVSVGSLVLVLVVVHPAAVGTHWMLSRRPLVEIGKRSYGWYLWHWPIFVFVGATDGSWSTFAVAVAISLVVAELSYRYVEEPVRRGALRRWWRSQPTFPTVPVAVGATAVLALGFYYWQVDDYDVAAGGDEAEFVLSLGPEVTAPAAVDGPLAAAAPPRVSIVGDSQAHSLAVNLPAGIEDTFAIRNDSLDGCSVYDTGSVVSSLESFSNSFASTCGGWVEHWGEAGTASDLVLVVLGAWDVFDLRMGDSVVAFGTPEHDLLFTTSLGRGLDAVAASGAEAALLEVACMRPVSAEGAAVPPLPERGDDARVAHVNSLLRQVADSRADTTFVAGPTEWCADEAIATDLGYRWDGVHVYKPGANIIYETIAPTLLALTD